MSDAELYEISTIKSQKEIELYTVIKINSSVPFEEALFSTDILCCVPQYSSQELLKFMEIKTTLYRKKMYNAMWTHTYGHQIRYDWDTIVGIANKKGIQTAV